jgi:hypothetical protein
MLALRNVGHHADVQFGKRVLDALFIDASSRENRDVRDAVDGGLHQNVH